MWGRSKVVLLVSTASEMRGTSTMKSSYASNRRSSRRLVSVVMLALLLAVTAVAPQSLQAVEVDQPYVGAAAVGTFSNTTAITWPDNTGGNASTFPSTITV